MNSKIGLKRPFIVIILSLFFNLPDATAISFNEIIRSGDFLIKKTLTATNNAEKLLQIPASSQTSRRVVRALKYLSDRRIVSKDRFLIQIGAKMRILVRRYRTGNDARRALVLLYRLKDLRTQLILSFKRFESLKAHAVANYMCSKSGQPSCLVKDGEKFRKLPR